MRHIYMNGGNYNKEINGNYVENLGGSYIISDASDDEVQLVQVVANNSFPETFDVNIWDSEYYARFTLYSVERIVYGSGREEVIGRYFSGSLDYFWDGSSDFAPSISMDDIQAGMDIYKS
jgi:hypothetical protein